MEDVVRVLVEERPQSRCHELILLRGVEQKCEGKEEAERAASEQVLDLVHLEVESL